MQTYEEALKAQAAVWEDYYTASKAVDAALVASVLQDILDAMRCGYNVPESVHCGMLSCYGSKQLKDHVFKKEVSV